MDLVRHVSFVDCPGHDILMATMLNGAAVMDGALLLIAANESCPQPQTSEHLAAVEIMRLKDIVILQNKVDLVTEAAAQNQHEAIQKFIQGTIAGAARFFSKWSRFDGEEEERRGGAEEQRSRGAEEQEEERRPRASVHANHHHNTYTKNDPFTYNLYTTTYIL